MSAPSALAADETQSVEVGIDDAHREPETIEGRSIGSATKDPSEKPKKQTLKRRPKTTVPPLQPTSLLPIGMVRSCFRECRGTPRQGFFAPDTRGRIEFDKKLQPDCTDGLEDFSHIWIVFLFHMNNNKKSNNAAQQGRGYNFKTKVKPPKLKGKSVGIFCTRTPHRPNAVGLTLAKLERVDGRTLHISALDLTDGTPVLDVKPYVPVYDSLPEATCPAWCGEAATHRQRVSFTSEALDAIDAAANDHRLQFYTNGSDVRRAIQQLIENDVRPDHAYRRFTAGGASAVMHFRFDMLKIGYIRLPQQSSGDGNTSPVPHMQVCEVCVETEQDARDMERGLKKRY